MSAQIGIFTRAYGVGDGQGRDALKPLPVREEGVNGLGKGRAAGHRVQLADWAYLIEAAEQRATWGGGVFDTLKHDVYPQNVVHRYYNAQGAETFNTEPTISRPSADAWSAVTLLDNARFFKADATPPACNDVFWSLGSAANDRPNYLYQFAAPRSSAGGTGRLRRVDDVRRLFYDLKSCTRCDTINGSYIYYDNGTAAAPAAPRVIATGPHRAVFDADIDAWDDADECRVINNSGQLHDLLRLHREVVQHAAFAVTPAYAIVQLRCTQKRNGPIIANYARYIRTTWTLDAQTATCTVDLAGCGCGTAGLAAWMNSTIGTYVTGDVYTGTAKVVDLVYDLAIPMDNGLFLGWTWTPSNAA